MCRAISDANHESASQFDVNVIAVDAIKHRTSPSDSLEFAVTCQNLEKGLAKESTRAARGIDHLVLGLDAHHLCGSIDHAAWREVLPVSNFQVSASEHLEGNRERVRFDVNKIEPLELGNNCVNGRVIKQNDIRLIIIEKVTPTALVLCKEGVNRSSGLCRSALYLKLNGRALCGARTRVRFELQ